MHDILVRSTPDCTLETAAAWTLAFIDDLDPTFVVQQWLDAGWRDPLLVYAALRICRTRELAEACLDWLGRGPVDSYDHGVTIDLARAMIELGMSRGLDS